MGNWGVERVRYLENAAQTVAQTLAIIREAIQSDPKVTKEDIVTMIAAEENNLRDAVNGLFPRKGAERPPVEPEAAYTFHRSTWRTFDGRYSWQFYAYDKEAQKVVRKEEGAGLATRREATRKAKAAKDRFVKSLQQ